MENRHKKEDRKDSIKTILIADEEKHTRLLLKLELEEEGYRALTADSVSTVYKILQEEQKVDLYIISQLFPNDMDMDKLKEQNPNVKIIFYKMGELYRTPYWANNSVIKSSDLTELMNCIKRIIG